MFGRGDYGNSALHLAVNQVRQARSNAHQMGLSIACLYYRMRSINIEYVLLLYDAFSYYRICAFAQYAVTTSE